MRSALVAALAGLCCGSARAASPSRNPDGWTSAELTETAAESEGSYQTLISNGKSDSRNIHNTIVTVAGDVNVPWTDHFSLRAGVGTDLTNNESNDASQLGIKGAESNNSALVFVLGPRWFFLDHPLAAQPTDQNPDRWPSLGLTLRGSKTISYGAGQAQGAFQQGFAFWNANLTLDLRIPTSDRWTVIPGLIGIYNYTSIPETPGIAGSKTVNRTLNASVDARYYFVGSNLIPNDSGQNPDKWTMLHAAVTAGSMIAGAQDIILTGNDTFRNQRSFNAGLDAGTRLPMTEHLTLLVDVQGTYTQARTDEAGAFAGTTNHVPAIVYTGVIRYYFF